jgi:hypothetical protein
VDWDRIKNPQAEIRNGISLDQFAAPFLGKETRHANLVMGYSGDKLSWTAKGVPVPEDPNPEDTFRLLFVSGSAEETARELRRLEHGRSILDDVRDQAKSLSSTLGQDDRDRIDLMFTSIRETERSFDRAAAWAETPKPAVGYPAPRRDPSFEEINERETLWYDIVRLAFETDSTRVILLTLGDAGRA